MYRRVCEESVKSGTILHTHGYLAWEDPPGYGQLGAGSCSDRPLLTTVLWDASCLFCAICAEMGSHQMSAWRSLSSLAAPGQVADGY